MSDMKVPIAKPIMGMEELATVAKVLSSGMLSSGPVVRKFEAAFAEFIGVKHAVACGNGTQALFMALKAAGIKEGDEVITSPFSFMASASTILMCGARPVFVDVCPKTFYMNDNVAQIEAAVTKKTKAILPVHIFGMPAAMDIYKEVASDHGLAIIEDACQAHGAERFGKKVGAQGLAGAFSFYPTKNMTTGEGGMVTTDDDGVADACCMLRNQGMATGGGAGAYDYRALGYNMRMTDIAAAIGIAQLRKLPILNRARRKTANFYNTELSCIDSVTVPFVPKGAVHVYHQYTVLINGKEGTRDKVRDVLAKEGVGTGVYYPKGLHRVLHELGLAKEQGPFEVTDRICSRCLSIPVHPTVSEGDARTVVNLMKIALE